MRRLPVMRATGAGTVVAFRNSETDSELGLVAVSGHRKEGAEKGEALRQGRTRPLSVPTLRPWLWTRNLYQLGALLACLVRFGFGRIDVVSVAEGPELLVPVGEPGSHRWLRRSLRVGKIRLCGCGKSGLLRNRRSWCTSVVVQSFLVRLRILRQNNPLSGIK